MVSSSAHTRAATITFLLDAAILILSSITWVHFVHLTQGQPGSLATTLVGACLLLAGALTMVSSARRRQGARFRFELAALAAIVVGGSMTGWLLVADLSASRTRSALVTLAAALLAAGLAMAWRWVALAYRLPGFATERILVIGTGDRARQVAAALNDRPSPTLSLSGFLEAPAEEKAPREIGGTKVIGSLADLEGAIERGRITRVVVALEERRGQLPVPPLLRARFAGVAVTEVTDFIEAMRGHIELDSLRPSSMIFASGFVRSPLALASKRALDLLLSALLLLVSAPVMALTALAIRLESPGPVIFRQSRVGLNGRVFTILKFRSMRQDAEKETGPLWASENDPRVTRVGRIIRKLRIDELPQLLNVFRGDMSFVGPRPERPYFVEQLVGRVPFYELRSTVRPGLTGWSQIKFRYGADAEDAREKLKFDLYYIKHMSPLFDLMIALRTVRVILTGFGSR